MFSFMLLLPTYHKREEVWKEAWKLVRPYIGTSPFERTTTQVDV